jgi:hypothetical protein
LDAKGVMEPYQEPRSSRGWLVLVLGVLVFTVFGAVVGYAWFNGMPGVDGEPPLIRAEAGPYRRAPAERGGLEVANVSSSIVSVLRPKSEPPRVERLLPPETPMALESLPPEEDAAPPAAEAEAPPAATADTPSPSAPDMPAADVPTGAPQGTPADVAAAPADVATAPSEPAPAEPAPAEPAPDGQGTPVPLAKPTPPPPAQLAAREPPATVPTLPRPSASVAPQRPAAAPPPERAAPPRQARIEPMAPAALPSRPVAPVGGDLYRLQLTAVRTEAGLTQAWAQLKQRYPRVLANLSPKVERADTSTGPLFRLQAGPFTSREAAASACSGIRASGGQCFIVGPVTQ